MEFQLLTKNTYPNRPGGIFIRGFISDSVQEEIAKSMHRNPAQSIPPDHPGWPHGGIHNRRGSKEKFGHTGEEVLTSVEL